MGIAEHKAFVSHLEANGSISITLPSRAGSSDRGLSHILASWRCVLETRAYDAM